MVNFIFRVETFTKGTSSMTGDKDMVRCFGQMDLSIRENGEREHKMEKDKFIWQVTKLWVESSKTVF